MLEGVPTIMTGREILDKAFHKANKMEVPDPDKYHRVRKTEEAQMRHIADTCCETLERYVKAFPTLERMPDYEREVLEILVGVGALRQALGHVDWARQKIAEVYADVAGAMRRERTILGIQAQKRRFSGRCGSLMGKIEPDLAFLGKARDKVRLLPTVHPGYPTVVIAGFPNVGKSSLLAAWTKAQPEIAPYAFTTKSANVGHIELRSPEGAVSYVQVVDTPGLLDRPDSQRNPVERQAVAALRHAADAVLFLVDGSAMSGYTLEEQERLLEQVAREMAGIPLVVAEGKADLGRTGSDRIKFSTKTGEGLEELKAAVVAAVTPAEPELELDPLELWKSRRDPMFG
jgi:nucleolar GTP-binding protein